MRLVQACLIGLALLFPAWLRAAETLPPKPAQYFNDFAGVISPPVAARLNSTLEQFERDNSSQIVVAIFRRLETASSIEDFTIRVARSWQVGQKGTKNGAVFFVFIENKRARIEVGYGLEGALPDALCSQIIQNELAPSMRAGNYDAALSASVSAILQAVRGEYKGNAMTVADQRPRGGGNGGRANGFPFFLIFLILAIILSIVSRRGRRGGLPGVIFWSGGGGGWGSGGGGGFSGGGGGGGFSGGGGGGFTGGGGDFGGGGASGDW